MKTEPTHSSFGQNPYETKSATKVLVTGDRNGFDNDRLCDELNKIYETLSGDMILVEGGAPGVDSQAEEWSIGSNVRVLEYPAMWSTQGRRAGPIRNSLMLKEQSPDLVIAFHRDLESSKGTKHMVSIAQKAGVKTVVISE